MLFFRKRRRPPSIPAGVRVYAVGDIHGQAALYARLLAMIEADNTARGPADTRVVLLGDLIDRGPDSAGVIARAMEPPPWAQLRALKGNHEAALLAALEGDGKMLGLWLRHGGVAAARSWGIGEAQLDETRFDATIAILRAAIPVAQQVWMARMLRCLQIGDYVFVHAGIRPGIRLEQQQDKDLFWIREEFLRSNRDHGAMIVHGHSISEQVEERANRIGIDTGAYASGRLTALGIEGERRWLIQTDDTDHRIPS